MTHRMGSKGQVVIPKPLRDALGIEPGAAVAFEEREGGILVRLERRADDLRGRYAGSGMAAALLEDRAREPR